MLTYCPYYVELRMLEAFAQIQKRFCVLMRLFVYYLLLVILGFGRSFSSMSSC